MHTTSNPTVLGVWAHPDDEAYLSTGLALRAISSGGRVANRHLTRGELGTADPVRWPPERLARHRTQELAESHAVVGIADHEILGLPDGGCATSSPDDAVRWIAGAITRLAPDVIVTFGSDGMTGHADHRAVSRWTTRAWVECGIGALLYAAAPRSDLDRFGEMYERLGFSVDPTLYVPDDEVVHWIALTPDELDTKRRCLAAHATQTEPLVAAMGEDRYRDWIGTEAFRLPRPEEVRAARLTMEPVG